MDTSLSVEQYSDTCLNVYDYPSPTPLQGQVPPPPKKLSYVVIDRKQTNKQTKVEITMVEILQFRFRSI